MVINQIDKGFNSRSREESDIGDVDLNTKINVSIHALVKRATSSNNSFLLSKKVSIHALVKRAT